VRNSVVELGNAEEELVVDVELPEPEQQLAEHAESEHAESEQ